MYPYYLPLSTGAQGRPLAKLYPKYVGTYLHYPAPWPSTLFPVGLYVPFFYQARMHVRTTPHCTGQGREPLLEIVLPPARGVLQEVHHGYIETSHTPEIFRHTFSHPDARLHPGDLFASHTTSNPYLSQHHQGIAQQGLVSLVFDQGEQSLPTTNQPQDENYKGIGQKHNKGFGKD